MRSWHTLPQMVACLDIERRRWGPSANVQFRTCDSRAQGFRKESNLALQGGQRACQQAHPRLRRNALERQLWLCPGVLIRLAGASLTQALLCRCAPAAHSVRRSGLTRSAQHCSCPWHIASQCLHKHTRSIPSLLQHLLDDHDSMQEMFHRVTSLRGLPIEHTSDSDAWSGCLCQRAWLLGKESCLGTPRGAQHPVQAC